MLLVQPTGRRIANELLMSAFSLCSHSSRKKKHAEHKLKTIWNKFGV